MIQRIQSVFLLIASISFFSLFKLPFAGSDKTMEPLFEDQFYNINDNVGLLGLVVAGGVISLLAIFIFKNRKFQKTLVLFGIVISIILIALIIGLLYTNNFSLSQEGITNKFGFINPILSVIFLALANFYIRKDDKLVKSMDRLR